MAQDARRKKGAGAKDRRGQAQAIGRCTWLVRQSEKLDVSNPMRGQDSSHRIHYAPAESHQDGEQQ
jgi:hypothetical protein